MGTQRWFKRCDFKSEDLYALACGPWPACYTARAGLRRCANRDGAMEELGIPVSDDILRPREAELVRMGDCYCEGAICNPREPICSYPRGIRQAAT